MSLLVYRMVNTTKTMYMCVYIYIHIVIHFVLVIVRLCNV